MKMVQIKRRMRLLRIQQTKTVRQTRKKNKKKQSKKLNPSRPPEEEQITPYSPSPFNLLKAFLPVISKAR